MHLLMCEFCRSLNCTEIIFSNRRHIYRPADSEQYLINEYFGIDNNVVYYIVYLGFFVWTEAFKTMLAFNNS